MRIAVLGAGVIGLSSAVALAQAGFGDVHIVADTVSPGTVSDGAGALWLPYGLGDTPEALLRRWSYDTLRHYLALISSGQGGATGVQLCEGSVLSAEAAPASYWNGDVFHYRLLGLEELAAHGEHYASGQRFTAVMANPVLYLTWLTDRATMLGCTFQCRRVDGLHDPCLAGFDVVVNCCGVRGGVFSETPDEVVPVKGQLLHVRLPGVTEFVDDVERLLYVLPRPQWDSVIFGGSYVTGDGSTTVDDKRAEEVLQGCLELLRLPKDTQVDVVRRWAGGRPYRKAGVRLEAVVTPGRTLVHNYGHGGSGHTLHWGCAVEVVRLVRAAASTRAPRLLQPSPDALQPLVAPPTTATAKL